MATSTRPSAGAYCAASWCMRCGSTYRVEVDHIIARARGDFGREYQWMPRNLQILCREHNQEKMTKFDDWRPLWARVLMPVRDTRAAHYAETLAALSSDEYRGFYATTPLHVLEFGCSYPLSPYPGNTRRSCDGPPTSHPSVASLTIVFREGQCLLW